jgi:hypothetical protein
MGDIEVVQEICKDSPDCRWNQTVASCGGDVSP